MISQITFPKKIVRWGNSLVILITSDIIKELNLHEFEMVDVTIKKRENI